MHYYIDGYNLLFRLMYAGENLQSLREQFIQDLNKKASLLKLDITLVFDAPFQDGEGSRTHYDALEIQFTSYGESADEFLISEIKQCPHPQRETVVTSDKRLAWKVRSKSAHTETVETFIDTVNRMYRNKLKQLKSSPVQRRKMPLSAANSPVAVSAEPMPPSTSPQIPSSSTSTEECREYYEHVFEASYSKLLEEEKANKALPHKPKRQPKPRQPSHWPEESSSLINDESASQRWERIFEKRFENQH